HPGTKLFVLLYKPRHLKIPQRGIFGGSVLRFFKSIKYRVQKQHITLLNYIPKQFMSTQGSEVFINSTSTAHSAADGAPNPAKRDLG
ncbi:MAG: hypothetical protein P8175_08660, partial [Deltaproteobacteria bacterium]